MTQDEIIEMARRAGALEVFRPPNQFKLVGNIALENFAKLVAAKERERFASECIDLVAMYGGSVDLEAAIRARSISRGEA